MNKQDRTELAKALGLLEEAKDIVDRIANQEQEKYDNLSEGLQASERGQKFEENSSNLADVVSNIETAIDDLGGVMDNQ